jgi:hypothetical protein
MQTSEESTTRTLNGSGSQRETENARNEKSVETKSTPVNETGTIKTSLQRQESRTIAAYAGRPILVSEQQFVTVKEEHLASMDLLNSSANVLLGALNSMVPPEGSHRQIGDYTGDNMRKISKSICDLIQTKNSVIRSMYQIARDEI